LWWSVWGYMRRRSKTSRHPVKSGGHPSSGQKPRKAPTRRAFAANPQEQIERLRCERDEALEQQAATSQVLQVISSSPGDLEPVFHAMLENATRICEAACGNFFMCDGPVLTGVAIHGNKDYVDYWRRNPVIDLREHPGVPLDRIQRSKQIVHIADLRTDPTFLAKDDRMVNLVGAAGARTYLTVPLLKEGELVGIIALYRQEVRTSRRKPLSPSRTRGCSTNCVSAPMIWRRPWSIKLRPARFSTSLAGRLMHCSRFWMRF
jgi:two-component system NtrC family sensor kinase